MSERTENKPERVSNAERTRTTRALLLDSTIKALAEYGYQGATAARIAELSKLTRGAQNHHFSNKANLLTAALQDVHTRFLDDEVSNLEKASEKGIRDILEVLWRSQLGELSVAALELRVAARIDEELQGALIPAERDIGRRATDFVVSLLDDGIHTQARLRVIVELIFNSLRGMAEQSLLFRDERRERRQLDTLEEAVRALLVAHPSG